MSCHGVGIGTIMDPKLKAQGKFRTRLLFGSKLRVYRWSLLEGRGRSYLLTFAHLPVMRPLLVGGLCVFLYNNHHFVFDDLKRTAKAEGWAVPADCATWEEALSQDSTTQQAKRLVDSFEQPVEVFGAKTKLSHEAARLAVKQYAQRNERMHSEVGLLQSIDKDLEDLPTILPAANLGSQEPAWREIIAYYGNECFGTQDAVSAVGEDSTDEPGKETSSDESVEEASTSQEDVDTTIPLGDLALGNSYDDDDNIQLGGGTLPKHGAATPHPDEPFPKNAKVNDGTALLKFGSKVDASIATGIKNYWN
ncbi:hypothetical protein MBM_03397 [Drepanopeziza brunnea f. sp. 'multigermtubi' MB_m1]|uniref:Uncharacterized protein n=1 Tax=Marssonina brunnea f. sp. multigermtubi (strain MB_m1) TaxID=1072389 RepID=K1XZW2_MARBU|nr:uncharacterized protein MBM_03397 [Drepanopeziza brunnea f. sp. 'multigermtubi' MB_m1]EKD18404.1 hypothetical protein MBM_03397 [Drepanopeziza brunnea f. sp. 'multigermtubi' MB_m1]